MFSLKSKSLHMGFLLGLLSLNANADVFSIALKSAVKNGVVDKKTVDHNLKQFQIVLKQIESIAKEKKSYHANRQERINKRLDYLDLRLRNQLGSSGHGLATIIASDITTALEDTRAAARNYDYKKILKNVEAANQYLNNLKSK